MPTDHEVRAKKFAEFYSRASDEVLAKISRDNIEEAEKSYKLFESAFKKGECYLCRNDISSFDEQIPCLHWLLRPKGFKGKHLLKITDQFGFFELQTYLRWVANQDKPLKNINDLEFEKSENSIIEETIKYGDLEWSLSCKNSDYNGHKTTKYGRYPHYHIQIRQNEMPFINYSKFHLPFTETDLDKLAAYIEHPDKIKQYHGSFGAGLNDLINQESLEELIQTTTPVNSIDEAEFEFGTLLIADKGKTINGEDIYQLMKEAKEKNVPMASLTHKIHNVSVKTMVSPGPALLEKAKRSASRKKKG